MDHIKSGECHFFFLFSKSQILLQHLCNVALLWGIFGDAILIYCNQNHGGFAVVSISAPFPLFSQQQNFLACYCVVNVVLVNLWPSDSNFHFHFSLPISK